MNSTFFSHDQINSLRMLHIIRTGTSVCNDALFSSIYLLVLEAVKKKKG